MAKYRENIGFQFAVWNQASGPVGFVDIQSAQIFNGSVRAASTLQLSAVRNVTFSSCNFRHLGGVYAITAEGGSQGVTVENCTFSDLSGGGVKFGSVANCSTGCANSGPSAPGTNPGTPIGHYVHFKRDLCLQSRCVQGLTQGEEISGGPKPTHLWSSRTLICWSPIRSLQIFRMSFTVSVGASAALFFQYGLPEHRMCCVG